MTSNPDDSSCPKPVDRFSMAERTLMQLGLYGLLAIGFHGIHRIDPAWAWGYLAYAVVGFFGGVLSIICSRCPYPYGLKTCLFLPVRVVPALYAQRRTPIETWQKVVVTVFFLSLPVLPLPWLIVHPPLLAGFLALVVPVFGTVLLYYCKRCRNRRCPFNRAQGEAG